jgi:hypothetical protein
MNTNEHESEDDSLPFDFGFLEVDQEGQLKA